LGGDRAKWKNMSKENFLRPTFITRWDGVRGRTWNIFFMTLTKAFKLAIKRYFNTGKWV